MTNVPTTKLAASAEAEIQTDLLDQIREQHADVQDTKHRIGTLVEMQQDYLENLDEYQALQQAKDALKGTEDKLKIKLSQAGEYNDRQEEISALRGKQRDQEDILSLHLIEYRDQRKAEPDTDIAAAEAIEMDGLKERPIKLVAKLGRERDIQTSMDFNGKPDNE